MNTKSVAVLVAALGISGLALWGLAHAPNEGGGAGALPGLGGASAATPGLQDVVGRRVVDEPVLELQDSRGREALVARPPREARDEGDVNLLPEFEDVVILGWTGAHVMETYWGDDWPLVESVLRRQGGDYNVDALLVRDASPVAHAELLRSLGTDRLQRREEYLKHVRAWILAEYDSSLRGGFPYPAIVERFAGVEGASASAYEAASLIRSVLRRVVESLPPNDSVALDLLTQDKIEASILSEFGGEITGLAEELSIIGARLSSLIRAGIGKDLEGVEDGELPRIGRLLVSPFLSVPWPPDNDFALMSTDYVLNLGASGIGTGLEPLERGRISNVWTAMYCVDVRELPGVRAEIETAQFERERVSKLIYATVASEVERHL